MNGKQLDAYMIVKDEEELIEHSLSTFAALGDYLGVLHIVDNGSTDGTLDIIRRYRDERLMPIEVSVKTDTPHHGELRTFAISGLKAPWILYLDADETLSRNFISQVRYIIAADLGKYDVVSFEKYWTIIDREHFTDGAYEGAQARMFRNRPGVHFPQKIHTEPMYEYGNGRTRMLELKGVYCFDHTGCKSMVALRNKGERYQWAQGEPFIGDPNTYVRSVDEALKDGKVRKFPQPILDIIEWGPMTGGWAWQRTSH